MRLWFLFYLIIGSEANLNQWTSLPLEVLKSPKVDKYGFFGKQLDFIQSVQGAWWKLLLFDFQYYWPYLLFCLDQFGPEVFS